MNPRLHQELTVRLLRDYRFKERKEFLQLGECPSCGQKELYASTAAPWVLRCGRLNNCGWEGHVKELYPDLFEDWSRHYPTTPENPNAAADAYLSNARGFQLDLIKGWYAQESYWNHELDIGSATVRFPLPGIGYWERIIDRPERFGKRKATFHGQYKGAWWQHPGLSFTGVKELWIVEGIFDAIALLHSGLTAVASLSCSNFPEAALAALAEQFPLGKPELVFAYDGDKAGRDYTKKHVKRAIEMGFIATAAQIPQNSRAKLDWNDLLQRKRLDEKNIEEYRYHGALLLAKTPFEKARLIYGRKGLPSFAFDFENRLYFWKLDVEKQAATVSGLSESEQALPEDKRQDLILQKSSAVVEVCNCRPVPLYFLKNEVTDESWYYFRIDFPHGGPSVKNTFTAGQLAAGAEFKKRLLHTGAGAIWRGTAGQLDTLLAQWTFNLKQVETIDFIGYRHDRDDASRCCYVFDAVAVQGDRVVKINDEDYFDLGKLSIKSLSKSLRLDINTEDKGTGAEWFDRLYTCFGARGVVALAAWFGSLFAEQIRHRFESFPFVEIVGEPGAGKSTLLEALWKLLGRIHEGFDPLKGSQVGFMRTMAQVANLPVVLIESDRESESDGTKGRPTQAFHWDSLKSLYNGGSLRTTGVKSNSNDTYDPQFRAALFISQNAPVQASLPIMERIVHIWLDKSHQTSAARETALELGRMAPRDMSSFLLRSVTREASVMALMEERLREYEREIEANESRNQRIQKNHAQLMVFVDALASVCPITSTQQAEARDLLVNMALEREKALAREHPIVEAFWEAFDFLDGPGLSTTAAGQARLNHSKDPALIAINLNHFVKVAAENKQQIPLLPDLKRLLKSSRRPKFAGIKAVSSAINSAINADRNPLSERPTLPETVKCWVFER